MGYLHGTEHASRRQAMREWDSVNIAMAWSVGCPEAITATPYRYAPPSLLTAGSR